MGKEDCDVTEVLSNFQAELDKRIAAIENRMQQVEVNERRMRETLHNIASGMQSVVANANIQTASTDKLVILIEGRDGNGGLMELVKEHKFRFRIFDWLVAAIATSLIGIVASSFAVRIYRTEKKSAEQDQKIERLEDVKK